jgi:hypothetical protein
MLLHTSKPLISTARKYSIVATSNILSLYIWYIILYYIHLLQRRKIQNRREYLATLGYVTLSIMVINLARTKRFLHLFLGCES